MSSAHATPCASHHRKALVPAACLPTAFILLNLLGCAVSRNLVASPPPPTSTTPASTSTVVKVTASPGMTTTAPESQISQLLDASDELDTDGQLKVRRLLVRELTKLIIGEKPDRHAMDEISSVGLQLKANVSSSATSDTAPSEPPTPERSSQPLVVANDDDSSEEDEFKSADQGDQRDIQQQQPEGISNEQEQDLYGLNCDYDELSPPEQGSNVGQAAQNVALSAEGQQQVRAGAENLLSPIEPTQNQQSQNHSQDEAGGSMIPLTRHQAYCAQKAMSRLRMIEMITKVITPILFSIIIVVGLVGNIVVMVVILEDRKTERELTPTGLLILDLSLADLSFIIFCIPFTGWDYSVGHWVFGLLWCKFNQYLIVVCALSSIYTLVLMSVDRFMAIVYPIECMSYRTSKNTLYAIYIKWIVILLMASPTIPMHGLVDSGMEHYQCRFLHTDYDPLIFQIVFFITSYLFPLILIFCLYLTLLNKLWFGNKPHGHKESVKTLESKKKVTWLVASIVIVFALCWCPIQVMLILMRLKTYHITATYVAIQVFSHTLGYMNSCVNPIVYAFASESFLNSFKRSSVGRYCYMCFCIFHNDHHQDSHNHHHSQHQHHHQHQQLEPERSTTNFRANHNNNTAVSAVAHLEQHHNGQANHHHHHLAGLQRVTGCGTNGNEPAPNNNGENSIAIAVPTTDIHHQPVSDSKPTNESPPNNRINSLPTPLEPRDRCVTPTNDSSSANLINSGGSGGGTSKELAKQQLVAHMVPSSGTNQISHRCEPRY